MTNFSLATLGCKTNQFESNAIEQQLKNAGFTKLPFEEGADLVVINTCTVTSKTDAQSRNLIRKARRYNSNCRVVVTGCYAQIDPDTLAGMDGVALVIGNEQKQSFVSTLIAANLATPNRNEEQSVSDRSISGRSRAFLQIQNGCDAFCSYCIIPFARGRSRSFAESDIIRQTQELEAAGYNEVVLTGIHIGGYGKELEPQRSLLELIQTLLQATTTIHLRLGSIEPNEIPAALIDLISTEVRISAHLHIPLQAGNDRILTAMNRHYQIEEFASFIGSIHDKIDKVGIGLDVITGFPGETEEEFEQSYQFIESLPIAYLHVFPYSIRPGTPAATMANQLTGNVIKERAERLRQLSSLKEKRFAEAMIGKTVTGIIEEGSDAGLFKGTCDNYQSIWIRPNGRVEIQPGQRLTLRISKELHKGLPIADMA